MNTVNIMVAVVAAVGVCGSVEPIAGQTARPPAQTQPYSEMANHIVAALKVSRGERVILRYDPQVMGGLEPVLRKALEALGAEVESLRYGPLPELESRLRTADIYVWLPAASDGDTPADQRQILAKWLRSGNKRQIHFHWAAGTRELDGLPGAHTQAHDRLYIEALAIDYASLAQQQRRVIDVLRKGTIRVTTPAGTDIRFHVGNRPFNRQDGDASALRTASAAVLVDREIELPAGAIRVAPLEPTVSGTIVVPSARFGSHRSTGVRLEFTAGKMTAATATSGQQYLTAFLDSGEGADRFREFGLGFNPKLRVPGDGEPIPYYGYGDAVVRLSLGDNTELGGAVRGGSFRWFFFADATVTVGSDVVVREGRLHP